MSHVPEEHAGLNRACLERRILEDVFGQIDEPVRVERPKSSLDGLEGDDAF